MSSELNLKEFLARQLNDHSDSPSGVTQKLFYEWTEPHIEQALCMALDVLYSLVPQNFTEVKQFETKTEDCIVDVGKYCQRFIQAVTIGDVCTVLEEKPIEVNNLSNLFSTNCNKKLTMEEKIGDFGKIYYETVPGSNDVIRFEEPLPKGTLIRYLCGNPPTLNDINGGNLDGYKSFVAAFALWWLFRTDSESRSNLERASLYWQEVAFFVETKLLIEFSLSEDDYSYGRKRVSDDPRVPA